MNYYILVMILSLTFNAYSSADGTFTRFSPAHKKHLISNCVAGFTRQAQGMLPGGLPDHLQQAYALCPRIVELLCQRAELKIHTPVTPAELFRRFEAEEEILKKEAARTMFGQK